jgi:hypothetical protein
VAAQFPNGALPKWVRERAHGRETRQVSELRELIEQKTGGRWICWVESHRLEPEHCATWVGK